MSDTSGFGQQEPTDTTHDLNTICFVVRQLIERLDTMKLVQVQAVHGGGGAIAAAGTVDVLPLVNQVDGNGNSTLQGTVYGIPWWRLQGGNGAVICDPQQGDIGYVVCADRDISNVKSTQAQANPGSFRKYHISDGIYVGGVLNGSPKQYIVFTSSGIEIVDINGNKIAMSSSGISVTGNLNVTGAITATQNITAGYGGSDSVTLQDHLHTSGNSGSPTSAPTAGT